MKDAALPQRRFVEIALSAGAGAGLCPSRAQRPSRDHFHALKPRTTEHRIRVGLSRSCCVVRAGDFHDVGVFASAPKPAGQRPLASSTKRIRHCLNGMRTLASAISLKVSRIARLRNAIASAR